MQGELGYRLEASVAAADLGVDFNGRATGYFQHRNAGFAGSGSYTADDINQFGGSVSAPMGPVSLSARYDQTNNTTDEVQDRRANVDAKFRFGNIKAGVGLGYSDAEASGVQTAQSTTLGGDIGATFGDYSAGLFGQYDLQNASRRQLAVKRWCFAPIGSESPKISASTPRSAPTSTQAVNR